MYAIIATGGKQYKVAEGDSIKIEKIDAVTAARLTAEAQEAERAYYENEEPIRIRFKEQSAEDLL